MTGITPAEIRIELERVQAWLEAGDNPLRSTSLTLASYRSLLQQAMLTPEQEEDLKVGAAVRKVVEDRTADNIDGYGDQLGGFGYAVKMFRAIAAALREMGR